MPSRPRSERSRSRRSPAQRMAELGIALEDRRASASDETLILEPLLSDVLGHLAVGVDAAVELHHHLIGQLLRDRIHDLGDLRVLIEGVLTQSYGALVLDEEVLIVLEDRHVVRFDPG